MTVARGKISASLAARGRPAMWANEQESAVLSGVCVQVFRQRVKEWERRGFPQVNPDNGKRSIPAILAFWGLPANHSGVLAAMTGAPQNEEDDDGQENWGSSGPSERRAS